MISKDEIEEKARELDIHIANVERDYVFGWLLSAFYQNSYLAPLLIFKGGNCMRKAYYPDTRFSSDLDFSVVGAVDAERTKHELNSACDLAQNVCGVQFLTGRTSFDADQMIDDKRQSYKGRIYFRDFHGNEGKIIISVRVDISDFERLFLPTTSRPLIHPYSDFESCTGILRCMSIEEMLANKLKCLIQRRYSYDLYDFVYATFFERALPIDRSLVLSTFLRKTIFQPSPGAAKEILMGLPTAFFKSAWEKYIVCPLKGRFDFDTAWGAFADVIESIFGNELRGGGRVNRFYPANLRNDILSAGSDRKVMRLTYQGVERLIEPYALTYKRRKDGQAAEYFYAYDTTGGHTSGPSIKTFLHEDIQSLEVTDAIFEPRYPVELSKAGESPSKGYFSKPEFGDPARRVVSKGRGKIAKYAFAPTYKLECPYCRKRFTRSDSSTSLNPHKDPNGYRCGGRVGYRVL